VFTAVMAFQTRRLAQEAAAAARAEHEPLIIGASGSGHANEGKKVPFRSHGLISTPQEDFEMARKWFEGSTAWMVVKVRNAGRGTALVKDFREDIWIDLNGEGTISGEGSFLALAPGDDGYLIFADQLNTATTYSLNAWLRVSKPFSINVRYSDMDRSRQMVTSFHFGPNRPEPEFLSLSRRETSG
jgi:hypothetical protein